MILDFEKSRGIQKSPSPCTWKKPLTWEKFWKDVTFSAVDTRTPAKHMTISTNKNTKMYHNLTSPLRVFRVQCEETPAQWELCSVRCRPIRIAVCGKTYAIRKNDREFRNKYKIPQNVGSLSSSKGPRGAGNCSWKCALTAAANSASMAKIAERILAVVWVRYGLKNHVQLLL